MTVSRGLFLNLKLIKEIQIEMILNKKAELGNQVSVVYFILLFVIIGLGLTWGIYSYFGGGYDVRSAQAKWLAGEIENCIEHENVNLESRNEFFEKCNLNEKILNDNGFIVQICEGNCYNKGKPVFSINSNYQLCGFNQLTSKKAPLCSEKEIEINGQKNHLIVGSKINPRRQE